MSADLPFTGASGDGQAAPAPEQPEDNQMGRHVHARWIAALSASMLVLAVAVAVEAERGGTRRTAAGTAVGGLPAAGLDQAGLVRLITSSERRSAKVLTIDAGTKKLRVPRAELGVTVDAAATAAQALAESGAGRSVGPFREQSGRAVALIQTTDEARLARTTTRILQMVTVPAFNGSISYDNGKLVVKAPSAGQRADPERVREALRAYAGQLPARPSLRLPITPLSPRISQDVFAAVAAQGRAVLAQPMTLQAGARRARITPQELGPQLAIDVTRAQPALALRASALEDLAAPAARELSQPVRPPRLSAPTPATLLSMKGDASWDPRPAKVTVLAPGTAGQSVTAKAVLDALTRQLKEPVASVTVPAAVSAAPTTAARRINAVLGTFTTRFACCQGRVTNIKRIAQVVDGTVIGPGQSFSLNDIAGRRTRAKGYVNAPFILDGELSSDVGGGVSQFATTVFNAAFFAGVRLDEHQAHSFYISRYPAGREATVNFPGIDLRWTNTTSTPILVRASTTGTSVSVALYGRDDGRRVQALTGERRSAAGRDFAITVTRVMALAGQPPVRQRFTTVYNDAPVE